MKTCSSHSSGDRAEVRNRFTQKWHLVFGKYTRANQGQRIVFPTNAATITRHPYAKKLALTKTTAL
jgi:hypothetical protein